VNRSKILIVIVVMFKFMTTISSQKFYVGHRDAIKNEADMYSIELVNCQWDSVTRAVTGYCGGMNGIARGRNGGIAFDSKKTIYIMNNTFISWLSYFDTILGNIHEKFSVILGEDLELELFKPYSFVFSKFHTRGNHDGTIGVIGPARLRYENIVPLVRYYGSLIEEVAGW